MTIQHCIKATKSPEIGTDSVSHWKLR